MEKRVPIHVIMQMIERLVHIGEQMENIEDRIRLQDYLLMSLANLVEELTSENN